MMTPDSDSFTLFLLCSHLGLPEDSAIKPLSGREWIDLERKLASTSIALAEIPGLSAGEIKKSLETVMSEAQRLAILASREAAIKEELERLGGLGIWAVTKLDDDYPSRLTERLKNSAPVLLYGAGEAGLLNRRGLAVVGSRNVDSRGAALSEFIGNACAESKLMVYSGGARGVDKGAMGAALAAGGTAAGLLAVSLEKAVRATDARMALEEGLLVLATPYSPRASFNVSMAMARNKLIYALSDFALVIASDAERGGTWAGAEEALKADRIPIFAVDGPDAPDGNRLLLNRGALAFPFDFGESPSSLGAWLEQHAAARQSVAVQGSLF